jgi:hypothetical protein
MRREAPNNLVGSAILIENTAESPAGSIEPTSERDENSSGRTIQINRLRGLAARRSRRAQSRPRGRLRKQRAPESATKY